MSTAHLSLVGNGTAAPATPVPPGQRLRDLGRRLFEARQSFDNQLRTLGVPDWPSDHSHTNPITTSRREEFDAQCALTSYLERRVAKLERTLRDVLASDACQEREVRANVIESIYGSGAADRDPRLLSPTELALIAAYRQADSAMRQTVRVLLKATTTAE